MAQDTDAHEPIVLRGQVKWFDPSKGFGFVIADEGGADILLHANVLRNFGQSSVADGSMIEITVQSTERGRQAVSVLSIEPPEGDGEHQLEEFADGLVDPDSVGPLEPARVKWFDKAKGFGFANVFGRSEDVFIHVEVLRRSGLADLQPGEAIGLRSAAGKRGCMAVSVTSWDTAVDSEH
ncbi:cold shock domain-containing protein [Aliiroseovarius sp. M344]|uniref:cold-shock protein n=1 Tax=Aliiroseovarius sp. M344 TaxID=2867010 RepID=UPI0021ADF45D|nr:cold shock domain-containing protein [Aliiroseovarius sp. M344]UWQ13157.1 cold shock domain-containing protein [Aliiroseovarius sp. M344]